MTDNKNISPEEKKNLKHADIDKFGGDRLASDGFGKGDFLIKEKKTKSKQSKKPSDKKRKVPLALDIIVALAIVLVVAALVVGVYFVFKYYADSYKDVSIQYTVLISGEDVKNISDANALKGKELYLDADGNTYYFGKVTAVTVLSGADNEIQISAKVSVDSKHRTGEGYSVEGNRIAVGSEYSLRTEESGFDVTIVEMRKGGGN